jgi:hypothetical protein
MLSNRKPRRQNGLRGFFYGKYGKNHLFLACPKISPHKHVKKKEKLGRICINVAT